MILADFISGVSLVAVGLGSALSVEGALQPVSPISKDKAKNIDAVFFIYSSSLMDTPNYTCDETRPSEKTEKNGKSIEVIVFSEFCDTEILYVSVAP